VWTPSISNCNIRIVALEKKIVPDEIFKEKYYLLEMWRRIIQYKFADAPLFASCLKCSCAYYSTMKMEAVGFFETSMKFNGSTLRQEIPLFIVTAVTTSVITKILTFLSYRTLWLYVAARNVRFNPCLTSCKDIMYSLDDIKLHTNTIAKNIIIRADIQGCVSASPCHLSTSPGSLILQTR
jgi:hypothetical protein